MNYKNFLPLLTLILICSTTNAQQTFLYKSKSLNATPNWEFICNNYVLSGTLHVQIATTDTGGILKLAIKTTNENFIISGNVYVDLKDISFIRCTDKNDREYKDGYAIAYYYFTAPEIKRLQTINIQDIRFTVSGKNDTFSNQTGAFTAVNKSNYFSTMHNSDNKVFETAEAIKTL